MTSIDQVAFLLTFLAHQRTLAEAHARINARTLFGLSRAPCDKHIRSGGKFLLTANLGSHTTVYE